LADALALGGLWLAAFLAATPVPFQSEVVFLGLQAAGWGTGLLILVASIGNTLGSCVTYALGRWLSDRRDHPWFPVQPAQMARAEGWFGRWGLWLLLLSWAPLGDVIVAVSGVMRVPFPLFLMLVAVAKTGRYIALGWLGATAFGG
jgi:membrane protein YqaA with SNARE-associated domain